MKFLHRPLKQFIVNQKFGQNNACVDNATSRNVITCDGNNPPAGYRSLYGSVGHLGVDLAAYHGMEVYCILDGVVDSIDTELRSGLDMRIVSEYGGKKYRHIYEHLMGYQPKIGDRVRVGQLVGWANNSGWSSGDHLHLQFEEWDGDTWIPIDPLPYMSDKFAKDILYTEDKIRYLKEQIAALAERIADFLRRR